VMAQGASGSNPPVGFGWIVLENFEQCYEPLRHRPGIGLWQ
jgi:hypothetical protein